MKVEKLQANDLPEIVDIALAVRAESPIYKELGRVDLGKAYLFLSARLFEHTVLGVKENNRTLGFLVYSEDYTWYGNNLIFVDHALFVRPEARGNGIALALLKEYVKIAEEEGATYALFGQTTGIQEVDDLAAKAGFKPMGKVFYHEWELS